MRYKMKKDIVIFNITEDEFVLFNSETDELVVINKTGKQIWDLLQEAMEIDQICKKLSDDYKYINNQELCKDINSFLEDLLKKDLIIGV